MAQKGKGKENDENSAWATESAYDNIGTLEELVALKPFKSASDGKGGSYTAAARIPVWLERRVRFLTESNKTPYELMGDTVRDAIYLGLKVLSIRYESNPDWAAESKMAKVLDGAQTLARLKKQVSQLHSAIREFWEAGDHQQAVDYLEEYVAAAVEIVDEYQRNKTLQLISDDPTMRMVLEKCNDATRNAVVKKGANR